LRSCNGISQVTSHTRPVTPDYLELRVGQQNTVLFPGGLPFHQRSGGRMIDLLLIVPVEECRRFDIGIGLDRLLPAQTAQGMVTPMAVAATTQGPPHVGATGWLFHLDAPQVLLTSLRPAADGADGIVARLMECGGAGGSAELRCVRDPKRAVLEDARGTVLYDVATQGDACLLDVGRMDLINLRVEFSEGASALR
jgi:alpha-mannosidase